MKKYFLTLILCLASICSWADDSGYCGLDLCWYYEEATQTLTISGTGEMYNFTNIRYAPWGDKGYYENIETVIIESGVTTIGKSAFDGFPKLTSVTIANSVTSIGEYAFRDCTALTSMEIPEGMTSIGVSAFYGCTGLKAITIPSSVTSIGYSAFYNSDNLLEVTSKIENPISIFFNSFSDNTFNNGVLYVPVTSIEKYKDAENWKKFNTIEKIKEQQPYLQGDMNGDGVLSVTDVGILITKILQGE